MDQELKNDFGGDAKRTPADKAFDQPHHGHNTDEDFVKPEPTEEEKNAKIAEVRKNMGDFE